jgi:hypothetical protein
MSDCFACLLRRVESTKFVPCGEYRLLAVGSTDSKMVQAAESAVPTTSWVCCGDHSRERVVVIVIWLACCTAR